MKTLKIKNALISNPFTDFFVEEEIRFYGISNYNKDGVEIKSAKIIGRCNDYLNKNFRSGNLICPRFFINGKLWMSLTPMEIQSHYIPIKSAHGKTAVGGLGMGYYLLKIMEKNSVSSIDVYESEKQVISFFIENFKNRKGFEKINFIHGDARKKLKNKQYDFVYMDIYSSILPDSIISDKNLFLKNNKIKTYHFWCQEKVIKAAYEINLIKLENIPFDVLDFFVLWSKSENANLNDHQLDSTFVKKCFSTFNFKGKK